MVSRLKAAVQHIHGRVRFDENWFITRPDQVISKQIISRENENFKKFFKSIEPEHRLFLSNLNSRHMEQGSNPGEKIGSFTYVSNPEPPYNISRANNDKQEEVFSLNELSEYRKMTPTQKATVGIPIIRISDKEDKAIVIVDLASNDRPCLFVKDIAGKKIIDSIGLASSAAWTKDGLGYMYTVPDKNNRPAEIKLRQIGNKGEDKVLISEPDEAFYLEISETKDKKFTVFYSMSRSSTEVYYIDRVALKPMKIIQKKIGSRYFVEHNNGFFYVVTNQDTEEFRLVRFSVKGNMSQSEVVLEGNFLIDEIDMYKSHIVIYSRVQGIPVVKILNLSTNKVIDLSLPYSCKAYSIQPGSNLDHDSSEFTIVYSSPSVYEDTLIYNFTKNELKKVNSKKIIGKPLRTNSIQSSRLLAPSFDGSLIPLTIISHKDIIKDRKNRLLLKGYGAYGQKSDHSFKYSEAVAAEQGWIIVNAHVRGEGEKGLGWHKAATKEKKNVSFVDYLACAFFLIKEGFTNKKYLAAYGSSAGGMLVAQCMNLKPELFAAAVLEVPFVDPLSEMLSGDLPLSVTDRDEWGDPLNDPRIFDEMRSYSPYDNLNHAKYPAVLLTGSESDSRVSFTGILKYIQRLRNKKFPRQDEELCDQNIALHITEGGHFGQGDLSSEAIIWGFLNKIIKHPGA